MYVYIMYICMYVYLCIFKLHGKAWKNDLSIFFLKKIFVRNHILFLAYKLYLYIDLIERVRGYSIQHI